jgi:hypothetical protein
MLASQQRCDRQSVLRLATIAAWVVAANRPKSKLTTSVGAVSMMI